MQIDTDASLRLTRLEDAKARFEDWLETHDAEIASLKTFQAESQGARRAFMLMWGVICTAVVLDLTAQAFIYKQQTKNAEDIRGVQETQQIILSLLKGEYRGK
jgi:hypothetical protein